MKSVRPYTHAIATSILALLAACGGGGGGGGGDGGSGSSGESGNPGGPVQLAQQNCAYAYAPEKPASGTGDDPLLPRQWHLRNEGQSGGRAGEDVRAIAAWSSSGKGEGVRLAIVDDAIETLHEDLFPNLAAFRNYRPGAPPDTHPLPCDLGDSHGTAVAGIAAARDGNGMGVAGVAPRVALAAYNALTTGSEADVSDALRRDADVTGVYSNSWGSPDQTGALHSSGATFRNAILDGVALARGGRGAVYVFPSGNGACAASTARCAPDDSNYDGYVNAMGVIAACAVGIDGRAPAWAEPGANILVCGMSDTGRAGDAHITTTDIRNGYRSDFSGTSASAPMVAGVAALILQANPSLTWRDVRLILATTARRNDSGSPDWQANQAGLHVHPLYGFGVADAEAATAKARSWTSVGGSASLKSCRYENAPARPLRDGATVVDTITVGQDCPIRSIEIVEIGFTASHPSSGDLVIDLKRTNTGSVASRLAGSRACLSWPDLQPIATCGSYDDEWVFTSVRNMNENPLGEWRLEVTDARSGSEGTWNRWTLTIHGH